MNRLKSLVVIMLLAIAVSLSACGGSDSDSNGGSEPRGNPERSLASTGADESVPESNRWPQELVGRWTSVDEPDASWTFRADGTGIQNGMLDFTWESPERGELIMSVANGMLLGATYEVSGDTLLLGADDSSDQSKWLRD